MTLSERQCAHTKRIGELIVYANAAGLSVKVVEWNRLLETQKEYVAKGVSWTLNSAHLDNCATDIYIIKNSAPTKNLEDYRMLGVYWENRGGRWGGRFKPNAAKFMKANGRAFDPAKDIGLDPYHFETPAA